MENVISNTSDIITELNKLTGKPEEAVNILLKNKELYKGHKVRYRESNPNINKEGVLDNIQRQGNFIKFTWYDKNGSPYSPEFNISNLKIKVSMTDRSIRFGIKNFGPITGEITLYSYWDTERKNLQKLREENNPNNEPTGHFTGRCGKCGSNDLWDDNLSYGCNSCGAIFIVS